MGNCVTQSRAIPDSGASGNLEKVGQAAGREDPMAGHDAKTLLAQLDYGIGGDQGSRPRCFRTFLCVWALRYGFAELLCPYVVW